MVKKTIDEELLKEMAAKGFRKRPGIQTTTKQRTDVSFEPQKMVQQAAEQQRVPSQEQPLQAIQPPAVCQNIAEYQKLFLTNTVYTDRCTFSIHRETLELLKMIVAYSGQPTTISALIENILRQHLKTYRELINEATAPNIPKQTIPVL